MEERARCMWATWAQVQGKESWSAHLDTMDHLELCGSPETLQVLPLWSLKTPEMLRMLSAVWMARQLAAVACEWSCRQACRAALVTTGHPPADPLTLATSATSVARGATMRTTATATAGAGGAGQGLIPGPVGEGTPALIAGAGAGEEGQDPSRLVAHVLLLLEDLGRAHPRGQDPGQGPDQGAGLDPWVDRSLALEEGATQPPGVRSEVKARIEMTKRLEGYFPPIISL